MHSLGILPNFIFLILIHTIQHAVAALCVAFVLLLSLLTPAKFINTNITIEAFTPKGKLHKK